MLAASPLVLAAAVVLDLALGDPAYPLHPVRLVGRTLTGAEQIIRRAGFDGYGGGILLFVVLSAGWGGGLATLVAGAAAVSDGFGWLAHLFIVYSLLALGDLLRHVWRVERALTGEGIDAGRAAIARLVGRDTTPMDAAACRRAAIESLGENLTDGFTSPLFWYAVAGLPGLVVFKVVSTMDSMVGYKTSAYRRFGWCGARLDDLMNFVPARLTWLLIAAVAVVAPQCSGWKALAVGWRQHALLPGPNSGWSEAAIAGAIQRRLVGPIWIRGQLVTSDWLGDPGDPPASEHGDLVRAISVAAIAGLVASACVVSVLYVAG